MSHIFSIFISLFLLRFVSLIELPLSFLSSDTSSLRSLSFSESVFTNNTLYLMTIPLCFGLPQQCFNLLYSINTHKTYVYNSTLNMKIKHTYYISRSKTKKYNNRDNLEQIQKDLYANEICDIVSNFTDNKELLFSFYLVNEVDYSLYLPYDGSAGLAREYKDDIVIPRHFRTDANESYSLIDYLYKNRLIKRKVFAHKIFKSSKRGSVYLGEAGTNSIHYNKCKSNTLNEGNCYRTLWHCGISNITIKNKQILPRKKSIVFNSDSYYTIVPDSISEDLYRTLLGDDYYINKCKLFSLGEYGLGLFCDSIPENISDIILTIDEGFNVTIKGDQMFRYTHYHKFQIDFWGYVSSITSDMFLDETIVLGKLFIENYHMIFDYEDNTVGFIEMTAYKDISTDITLIKSLYMIASLLMVIAVIMLNITNKKDY